MGNLAALIFAVAMLSAMVYGTQTAHIEGCGDALAAGPYGEAAAFSRVSVTDEITDLASVRGPGCTFSVTGRAGTSSFEATFEYDRDAQTYRTTDLLMW
ncbi:hypothetical protein ACOI1H_07270 [Loktanella sp. DJP18]|uniref:hypothetical protein n=1 Tax=Loktanella sp. DJP18 TaxID=3409788 RepID=UPI003BB6DA7F